MLAREILRRPAQPGSRVQPTTPLPLSELDRTVANPIVRSLATIFMLRCDRDIGHAYLVTKDVLASLIISAAGWVS